MIGKIPRFIVAIARSVKFLRSFRMNTRLWPGPPRQARRHRYRLAATIICRKCSGRRSDLSTDAARPMRLARFATTLAARTDVSNPTVTTVDEILTVMQSSVTTIRTKVGL